MKKLLITCLGNSNDLINLGYLTSSIKACSPQLEIHVLCFKKNETVLSLMTNIDRIHCIDRSKISYYFDTPIFSDSFAINTYMQDLNYCLNMTWDEVINLSNDPISHNLLSALNIVTLRGSYKNFNGTIANTSNWANYYNTVHSLNVRQPISKLDSLHNLSDISYSSDRQKVKISEQFSLLAKNNFNKIRQQFENGHNLKFIGLSLSSGEALTSISLNALSGIIENLSKDKSLFTVLISNNTEIEKRFVNEINTKFENSLVTITCTEDARTPVLSNLDCLIGNPSLTTQLAGMLNVPVIEIREENDFSHFALPENSLLFYSRDDLRTQNTIISSINNMFNVNISYDTSLVAPLYQILKDDYGTYLSQIDGEINIKAELQYHVSRIYNFALLKKPINSLLLTHLYQNTDAESIELFTELAKMELTKTVKILLGCLRSLKTLDQSKDSKKQFATLLNTLIESKFTTEIVCFPIAMFEGKLDTLMSMPQNESIKLIESYLYELKNDIQLLASIIEEMLGAKTLNSTTQVKEKESHVFKG